MDGLSVAPAVASKTAHGYLHAAGILLDDEKIADARAALQEAASLAPDDGGFHRALQAGFQVAGLENDAITAEMAAIAFEQRSALMLYNMATAFLMTQRPEPAEKWFRAALRLDPALVIAHQNLASILEANGEKAEAQHHRDQAYGRQCVFVDHAPAPKRTVLVLCAAAMGNVPFDFLLPKESNNRIKWIMEYAGADRDASLPPHDVVFNAIGDHDAAGGSREAVERFLRCCDKPVINAPEAVARTARDLIPSLLNQLGQVVAPPAMRLRFSGGNLLEAVKRSGISAPVLLRPVGSHGGAGLQLYESRALMSRTFLGDQDYYLTAFYDFRSADGFCRKYRMIFVDRQPYPYHVAISEQWLVHYRRADMLSHQWKRDEELRFLIDPAAVLGNAAMDALRRIGEALDLDFCGIDFSLLPDGRLLVFEANATMLVHLEEFHASLAFKNLYVQRILDAFDAMLSGLTAK